MGNRRMKPMPETGVWVDIKCLFFSIDQSVPEDILGSVGVLHQFQPEGHPFDDLVETGSHRIANLCRFYHHTDLGVVEHGSGIEVQGTNKHLPAVENKRLGMQAGCG